MRKRSSDRCGGGIELRDAERRDGRSHAERGNEGGNRAVVRLFKLPGGLRLPLAGGLLLLAGCSMGGNYPVRGTVVDSQGQPVAGLEGSEVVFTQVEGLSSSVAEIRPDGSFEAYTMKPGDGVPPGKYTVHIPRRMLDPERAAPQVIQGKYEKPETAGLEVTVEEKKNAFEFKVERASGR